MNKFFKIIFSGSMVFVFLLFGATSICKGVGPSNEWHLVGKSKKIKLEKIDLEKLEEEIDGYGNKPWRDLMKIGVRKLYNEKLSPDYQTKYNILMNLKRKKSLSEWNFADGKLKGHFDNHGRSVHASNATEYLNKARNMIWLCLYETRDDLMVRCSFTVDESGRANIGHTAIITQGQDKYFLILGLNGDNLFIKTFYKCSNAAIEASYKNKQPIPCKIIKINNRNFAEYDGISIELSNAELEKEGNTVNVIIDNFDERGKPHGDIYRENWSGINFQSKNMQNKFLSTYNKTSNGLTYRPSGLTLSNFLPNNF